MFDIKQFLAENTITLNEGDPKLAKLEKELKMTKAHVKDTSQQYYSFPDAAAIKRMRQAMDKYEAAVLAVLKYMRVDYGKMSVR